MIRCPTCGRRIRDAAPVCPTHGPPPPAPPPSEEKSSPFVVPAPQIPAFRVRKTLGQGGFGAVFLAERAEGGEAVAIKVARPDNISAGEALLREADAMAAIGVPHVPAVFDRGLLDNGSAYVVMEFVKAQVLSDRLASLEGEMELEEFSRLALAILAIIEIAHGRSLVHCDLKPENVFIDERFGAKLFDFGLVRKSGAAAQRIESTKEEAPAGTPEYMSPEQCEARTDIDARSDIYALGVMFYEMLAGAPPFWGNPTEVQMNHRSRRPPALSRRVPVAVALEEAIMRCLAKDPERRFPNATELRRALQAGLGAERARREGTSPSASAVTGVTATDAAKPAPKPGAAARERRVVALLFFESTGNVAAIREAGNGVGAQIAHTAGAQYVLAFGHELGDNPTRAAANAGEAFVSRGLAKAVLVDLASVSVQVRPDGTRRYQSPLFTKKEQYPGEADPLGVLLSPAAVEVLPEAPSEELPNRPGFMRLQKAAHAAERTTTRMGVAPLVGRDDLLRTLIDQARSATTGAGPTITTLLGDVGYGKTHLAQMLVQHLEVLPRIQTIFVRAKEVLGGVGEQTTREMLQRLLGLPDAAPPDLGRSILSEHLGPETAAEVWAGVAVAMAWAPPEHPELRVFATAPGALRSAAARALGEGLRRASRRKPLALVVEDAHFVDETALDAFENATLIEASCPIWLCVVGRPSFGRGRTAWASRAAKHQEVTLGPLDTAAAIELARRLLSPAEDVPTSALTRLADRTQGIPMLLVELVRGLKRDGLVRKSDKGQRWYLATDELERLPDLPLVQWLSSRETESLPPDLLAHARLASVLGVEFSSEEIEGVLQEIERSGGAVDTQLDAGIGVRRLIESGILSRHRGGRVGFRHALLRDTVYQSVSQPQRQAIHHAAFDYFRRHEQLPEMSRLPQMAFHAARSGLMEQAGALYLDLAGRTAARHSYLDAELLYKNALDNFTEANQTGLIAAGQGRALMRFRLGRLEDAVKDFDAAIERARQANALEAVVAMLLDLGIVLDWVFDWARSRAASDEAIAIVAAHEELRTPLMHARLLMAQGRTYMRLERIPEMLEQLREVVRVAEKLGEEGYEPYTQSLSMIGFAAANIGLFDEAEAALDRCLEAFEAHGDMYGIISALQNRTMCSILLNKIDRLLVDFKRIVQIAREFGYPMSEATVAHDLGEAYFMIGQPDEAEPHMRRSHEMLLRMIGVGSRTESSEGQFVRVKWYRGDAAGAGESARALIARQIEAEKAGRTNALLPLSERLLVEAILLGLRAAPDEEFDAVVAKARETSCQPQDVVEMMETKALSALRAGRHADGVRLLEEALAEANRTAHGSVVRVRGQLERATAAAPRAAQRG
jgi:eukaryotic-like serine/threonine-protein kinase